MLRITVDKRILDDLKAAGFVYVRTTASGHYLFRNVEGNIITVSASAHNVDTQVREVRRDIRLIQSGYYQQRQLEKRKK